MSKNKLCFECPKVATCQTLCKDMKNYLNREKSKDGYSLRHIRRKEIPFNPSVLDKYSEFDADKETGWPKVDRDTQDWLDGKGEFSPYKNIPKTKQD